MRSRRLIQSPQPRGRLQDPQGFPPALTSHQFPPVHSIFIAAEGRRKHISSQRSSHGIAASQCAGMGDCRSGSRVVLAGRLPERRLTPREPTEWRSAEFGSSVPGPDLSMRSKKQHTRPAFIRSPRSSSTKSNRREACSAGKPSPSISRRRQNRERRPPERGTDFSDRTRIATSNGRPHQGWREAPGAVDKWKSSSPDCECAAGQLLRGSRVVKTP
jgi:hypothetical protein